MTETERGRRRRRVLIWIAVVLAAAVLGGLWLRWQQWGLETTVTEVELSALPAGFDGLRIVHLSDLHGHEYGENGETLLALVREQEPDLIVMTGDMADRKSQFGMLPALARGLAVVAPTYYVTGNHEWSLGTAAVKELKSLLEECDVTVLSNGYEILERGGGRLALAGVDDPNGYADQTSPEELYARIQAKEPGLFTLLLAHRSDRFGQYAAAGYDLVLSGHAHGGIIRLPFTDGLLGTDRSFFPTWTSGVYSLEKTTLFVSRGLGNNTAPTPGFRLFNRPELAVVVLKSARNG